MSRRRSPVSTLLVTLTSLACVVALGGCATGSGAPGSGGRASAAARSADGSTSLPAPPAGWQRLFEQGFDQDAGLGTFADVYRGWSAYDGSTDTSRTVGRPAAQRGIWDSRTTTTVHDGLWDCRLHTEGTHPQVCALTPTPNGSWWNGQRYGRYTVRFRADSVAGYKLAWLLWPSTGQWKDGEIDFPEGSLDQTVTAASHDITGNPTNNAYFRDTSVALSSGWHIATITLNPQGLSFDLDGRSWKTAEPDARPRTKMYWALQTETQLTPKAPPKAAEGHVLIDWLTIDRWVG